MYITFKLKNKIQPTSNLSFEDYFDNFNTLNIHTSPKVSKLYHTYTIVDGVEKRRPLFDKMFPNFNPNYLIALGNTAQTFIDSGLENHYKTFFIPKKAGGYRRIDAPEPALHSFLSQVKSYIEDQLKFLTHDSAYAYVKGRCTKDAIEVHQKAESKWFLKLDIKDFFTNCKEDFIYTQMMKVYPFPYLVEYPGVEQAIKRIITCASLNGGLPQGTPLSPTLTNLIMIPLDYTFTKMLRDYTYTRYADDILISSKYKFNWNALENSLESVLVGETPFKIKKEKTRFGSASGRNWNLGLMLNKDNNITVGYKKKANFKIQLNNFFNDYTTGNFWSIIDTQILAGQASYYLSIEPEYFTQVIKKYENRDNLNFKSMINDLINTI